MRKAGKKGDWSDGGDVVKCGNKYNRKCGPIKKNNKKKNKQNTFHSKQIIGLNQTHQPIKTHVPVG